MKYFTLKKNKKFIKGRKVPKFEIGDEAFLKNFTHTNVLQPKYTGPYEILKIFRNNNYLIKHKENDKTIKVNVSKLHKLEKPREIFRDNVSVDE